MTLEQRIEELEGRTLRLDMLISSHILATSTVKIEQHKPKGMFEPAYRADYWVVDGCGEAAKAHYSKDDFDNQRVAFGNCFRTKEAAEKAARVLRPIYRQLAWLAEHDDGWVADWDDRFQDKYAVYFDHEIDKRWEVHSMKHALQYSAVYMSQSNAEELCRQLNAGEYSLND
jgi:hypothetical protein